MKIRDVKIKLVDKTYPLKAFATVYIKDGFRVRNIEIIQHRDKSLSLEFENPMIRHPTFEPWTPEAKRMIERIVIAAYWKEVRVQHNALELKAKQD